MEQKWKQILGAFILGVLLPVLIFRLASGPVTAQTPQETTSTPAQTLPVQPRQVAVITGENQVAMMDLDQYLVGVVLAEMPASFEYDALKAQAVVARTYALKRSNDDKKHPGGGVCTDPACCQAYISPQEYLSEGGHAWEVEKIRQAVLYTEGYVLTYEGSLIEATYFSCSGGKTEDAVAVWGDEIPYLQSLLSPGEEEAENYQKTVEFSAQAFQDRLGRSLSGTPESWLGEVTRTAGGGVATMVIGGRSYTGTELRKLLSLNSTAFSITAAGDTVRITTSGKGHRVGMSQYGAEAMAVRGSTWEQILGYYYPGTRIDKLVDLG